MITGADFQESALSLLHKPGRRKDMEHRVWNVRLRVEQEGRIPSYFILTAGRLWEYKPIRKEAKYPMHAAIWEKACGNMA